MERPNLELSSSVMPEQWDIMARTARDLSPADGFRWTPEARNEIALHLRADDDRGPGFDLQLRPI